MVYLHPDYNHLIITAPTSPFNQTTPHWKANKSNAWTHVASSFAASTGVTFLSSAPSPSFLLEKFSYSLDNYFAFLFFYLVKCSIFSALMHLTEVLFEFEKEGSGASQSCNVQPTTTRIQLRLVFFDSFSSYKIDLNEVIYSQKL